MPVKKPSSSQKKPPLPKSETKSRVRGGSSSSGKENKKVEDKPTDQGGSSQIQNKLKEDSFQNSKRQLPATPSKTATQPSPETQPVSDASKNSKPQKAVETKPDKGPHTRKSQMASANPAIGIMTGEITTGFAGSALPNDIDPLGTKTAVKDSLGWSEESPTKTDEGGTGRTTTASTDEGKTPDNEPESYPVPDSAPVLSEPNTDSTYGIDSKGDVVDVKSSEMVNGLVSDDEYALGILTGKKTLRDKMAEESGPLLNDLKNNVPGADERFKEYWNNFTTGVKRFDELYPELDKKLNALKETLDGQGGQQKPENQPAIDDLVSLKTNVENLNGFLNDVGPTSLDLRLAWLNGKADPEFNKAWNAQEPRHEVWFNELERFTKLADTLGLKQTFKVSSTDTYEELAGKHQQNVDKYNEYRNDGSMMRPSKEHF